MRSRSSAASSPRSRSARADAAATALAAARASRCAFLRMASCDAEKRGAHSHTAVSHARSRAGRAPPASASALTAATDERSRSACLSLIHI